MAYSSIIPKKCRCGCNKWPTTGFQGYNADCRPDLKEEKIKQQKERAKKKNAAIKDGRALRVLAVTDDGNREMAEKHKTKSELLREADRLFSQFIRNRDADKNGNIQCVGCGKVYNLEQVDKEGKKIVQPLHFIDRGVYSLRFDEDNCHAGCSYCNLDMFLNKNGFAYRRYLEFMNMTYGEEMVTEMALAHRRINKITEQQLKTVIEYYSQLK
jgi:hypothetical protein